MRHVWGAVRCSSSFAERRGLSRKRKYCVLGRVCHRCILNRWREPLRSNETTEQRSRGHLRSVNSRGSARGMQILSVMRLLRVLNSRAPSSTKLKTLRYDAAGNDTSTTFVRRPVCIASGIIFILLPRGVLVHLTFASKYRRSHASSLKSQNVTQK